jgi:molecular chaperone DnaJ
MSNKRDYYEVLGISKDANADDIKRAFRKKAMEYHPDRNKAADAESKFKEVNEAYEVLSDPQKKQRYDQYGHDGLNEQQGFGGGGSFDFGDIFSQFFGGNGGGFSDMFGGRKQGNRRSNGIEKDVILNCTISFVDMVKGITKKIKYDVKQNCLHCKGTGAENPNDVRTCSRCGGKGTVHMQQRTPFGIVQTEGICPQCNGRGKTITEKCHVCKGNGFMTNSKELEVNIPAGIEPESRIRYSGYGNQTPNGNGDLILTISVRKSAIFNRKGNKIYVSLIIDPMTAIVGGEVKVPTPYGFTTTTLKPGIANGELVTIPGYGINVKKMFGSSKDDLIAIVSYAKPSKYGKGEIEKIKEMVSKNENDDVNSYLKKAKNEIE